jgi:hypothetical protein
MAWFPIQGENRCSLNIVGPTRHVARNYVEVDIEKRAVVPPMEF